MWIEPPADMGRPVWRDVLEQTQLGPLERAAFLSDAGTDRRRSHHLWGRIAAKEAARRIWRSAGLPHDVSRRPGSRRRRPRPAPFDPRGPTRRSIHAGYLDRPRRWSRRRAWPPTPRTPPPESTSSPSSIVPMASKIRPSQPENDFSCVEGSALTAQNGSHGSCAAKGAAAKASGIRLAAGRAGAEVIEADFDSGVIHVRLAPEISRNEANMPNPIRVISRRRAKYAWAWTLGEGVEP